MICVFCGTKENLNTKFTITLDDKSKKDVIICDEHAEDATVKSIRAAYLNREAKIAEVLKQAQDLGLDLTINQSGLTIAQAKPQNSPKKEPIQSLTENLEPTTLTAGIGNKIVSTKEIDGKQARSIGGHTGVEAIGTHRSHDFNLVDKLSDEVRQGTAEIAIVEGRCGIPINIPINRVDGTGSTHITISKHHNDQQLQTRFKKMANDSMNDRTPDFGKDGYRITNCPICHGDGQTKSKGTIIVCPKCKGTGVL